MERLSRRLNKYERAYLKKIKKAQKNRFFNNQKPSIGKNIIYNYYLLKNRFFNKKNNKEIIKHFIREEKKNVK